jgi:hypothetical protein
MLDNFEQKKTDFNAKNRIKSPKNKHFVNKK